MKLKKILTVMLSSLAGLSTASVAQQDTNKLSLKSLLEVDIIESTGFFAGDEKKNPGYLTVIDMDDIARGAQRSLRDIVEKKAPSFYMARHHSWGDSLGVRGFAINNSAKTMVMVDGMNLNMRTNVGYNYGFRSPLLGDVQRIELANSPSALVHGSGAIFGFVNMVSKNGRDNEGVNVRSSTGTTDGSHLLEASAGHVFNNDIDLFVYAGVHDADGFQPQETFEDDVFLPENQSPVRATGSPSKRASAFLQAGNLEAKIYYNDTNPSQDNQQSNRSRYIHLEQAGAYIKYDWDITPYETIAFDVSALLTDFGQHIDNHALDAENPNVYGGGGEEYRAGKIILKTTRFNGHNLAIGSQYIKRDFYRRDWKLSRNLPTTNPSSFDGNWVESSYFIEDVWSVTDKIAITAGLRYDELKDAQINTITPEDGDNLVKRGGLAYLWNDDTTFKLSYQEGFRFPDASNYINAKRVEVTDATEATTYPRRTILPESSESIEANASWNRLLQNPHLKLDFNLFYNTYIDSIKWDNRRPDEPREVGSGWINAEEEVVTKGGEIVLSYDNEDKLLTTSLSYSYAKNEAVDPVWQLFPQQIVKASFNKGWLGGSVYWHNDFYFDAGFKPEVHDIDVEVWQQHRFSWDTALVVKPGENLTFKLSAQNLTRNDTPALTVNKVRPRNGNLGHEERFYYFDVSLSF